MKKVIITTGLILTAALMPVRAHAEHEKAPSAVETSIAAVATPVEVGNTICPVSGEKIEPNSSMGEMVKAEHKGKIYNLCCEMCLKDFTNDPEKYSAIADKEVSESVR